MHPKARWPFESAEGCFSKAAIFSSLSIYFDVSQLTDAFHAPLLEKEAIVFPNKVERCITSAVGQSRLVNDSNNSNNNMIFPLSTTTTSKSCAYWINPKYQV